MNKVFAVLIVTALAILAFVMSFTVGFGVLDPKPQVNAAISCEDGSPVQNVTIQPFPGQTKTNTDKTTVFASVPVSQLEDKIITFLIKCQDHESSLKIDGTSELSLTIVCNAQECFSRLSN